MIDFALCLTIGKPNMGGGHSQNVGRQTQLSPPPKPLILRTPPALGLYSTLYPTQGQCGSGPPKCLLGEALESL
jgi:hypothetical protein